MTKHLIIILILLRILATAQNVSNISVDFNTIVGTGKKMTGVNTGPHSIVSGTTEQCLQNIGTELVRTHDYTGPCDYWGYTNFFNRSDSTFNYSFQSHLPAGYDWTATDAQISEIVNANLQPFFRLGISDGPGQNSPPATPMPKDSDSVNFYTFAGIAKRTAMHFTDSVDSGFKYTIPYWEIWNEPNNLGFWAKDSVSAYYRLYKQCADSLKSFNPQLKVGGPGVAKSAFLAGGIHYTIKQDYVANFFNFCKTDSVPLDFYSFHMYDRKNPYSLKILTDTLAYYLDQYGFDSTELIVSETNINTGGYENTSKGCSYLASQLISVANSRLSKYIWYRGVDLNPLCFSDIGSTPSLTLNGYAYKFFNELNDSTPKFLATTGNEFDNANIMDSLNNLMTLSGKNSANNIVKVLIANHESVHDTLNVTLQNLPWTSADQITITTEQVISSGYSTSTSLTTGGSTLSIVFPVTDASVYFITIKNESTTPVNTQYKKSNHLTIFPNPSDNSINFSEMLGNIQVYNVYGQLVLFQIESTKSISTKEFTNGIYFIHADNTLLKFSVDHIN